MPCSCLYKWCACLKSGLLQSVEILYELNESYVSIELVLIWMNACTGLKECFEVGGHVLFWRRACTCAWRNAAVIYWKDCTNPIIVRPVLRSIAFLGTQKSWLGQHISEWSGARCELLGAFSILGVSESVGHCTINHGCLHQPKPCKHPPKICPRYNPGILWLEYLPVMRTQGSSSKSFQS